MAKSLDDTQAKSKIAQVLIWILFITSLLSAAARLGTKYAIISSLASDDWLMIAGILVYMAECITASMMATSGLGLTIQELSEESIVKFFKTEYASIPLMILSFTLVKWSNSAFIRQLTPNKKHLRTERAISILTALWCLSSTCVFFFQCPLPEPWDYRNDKCINRRALWTYVGLLNILTDIGIITLYCGILVGIQTSSANKIKLLCIFSTRILVVATASGHIAAVWTSYHNSDITERQWTPMMLCQSVLCTTVVSACLPYLKPFMESLESGIGRVENIGSEEELPPPTNSQGSYSYAMTDGRSFTKPTASSSR